MPTNRSRRDRRVSHVTLRRKMCDIGRRIWQRGLCAGNDGNHSVRIGPDRVLCTPTLMSKGFLRPEDMVVVDMDGNQVEGTQKRTSEIFLHLAIYQARPDVTCVIHNHPPHATAFALSGIDLPTGIYPETETLLGKVPTAPYVLPGDKRLGQSIVPYLNDTNVVLLQNHGVVCFDKDLEQCYYKLEVVDQYARILMLVRQIGSVRMLTEEEMAQILRAKKRMGFPDARTEGDQSEALMNPFLQGLTRVD